MRIVLVWLKRLFCMQHHLLAEEPKLEGVLYFDLFGPDASAIECEDSMHKFMVTLYWIYELCLARLAIHVYLEDDLTGQWLVSPIKYNASGILHLKLVRKKRYSLSGNELRSMIEFRSDKSKP